MESINVINERLKSGLARVKKKYYELGEVDDEVLTEFTAVVTRELDVLFSLDPKSEEFRNLSQRIESTLEDLSCDDSIGQPNVYDLYDGFNQNKTVPYKLKWQGCRCDQCGFLNFMGFKFIHCPEVVSAQKP